jgi:ABC-2 type transport system ATP-binding protein
MINEEGKMTPEPPKGNENVIETRGVTKSFGQRIALKGVDLTVPRASAFGFVGPNGAGKTTLIRTLLTLTRPDSGSIRLLGHPMPKEYSLALAKVGGIVDEPLFYGHLTGRENLEIIAAAREAAADARIDPALARVGLADRARDQVKTYSTGMRQRLGVARCLLADPLLLILDEPTSGLDPAGIDEFRIMIRSLVSEGRTVFLSSHLLDEVEKICDHVAIIDQGSVLMQGPVAAVARRGKPAMRFRCYPIDEAERALAASPGVENVRRDTDALIVTIDAENREQVDATVSQLNRRLVESGVSVYGIETERISLEKRFLEVTSRLEAR